MNLQQAYARLLLELGPREFKAEEAARVLKLKNPYLMLHRLLKAGYLAKSSRGIFRPVHPALLPLGWLGFRWEEQVSVKEYLPFLERVVAGLLEEFWGKLVSLVLFGSLARGDVKPESDVDLLIVAEGLPESYSERLKIVRKATREAEAMAAELWRRRSIYPLIDPVVLTPEEASATQPFYLDLLEDSIIIYDRGFMEKVLRELRRKLAELGSRRVTLPDGSWYWVIGRPGEAAEV